VAGAALGVAAQDGLEIAGQGAGALIDGLEMGGEGLAQRARFYRVR
jgi:hypothetical protein